MYFQYSIHFLTNQIMLFFFIDRIKILVIPFLLIFFSIGGIFSSFGQNNSSSKINKNNADLSEYNSISDTLKKTKKGDFIPIPIPITDENLGYGGILSLAYMQENIKSNRENTPRTITGIAGGATSTGTWLTSVFHNQSFNNDKIRYVGLIGYADVFLDYYLLESIDLVKFPIQTNLKFWGTQHEMIFRLGNSKFFIGPQYRFMNINGGIKLEATHPEFDDLVFYRKIKEKVSALALLGNYDNRDQILSPVTGYYTGFLLRKNATWLGATKDYMFSEIYAYAYYKVSKDIFTIFHFDSQFITDGAPFYAKPYIGLRGVPAMRYQGNNVSIFEMQWRVNLVKNISMVVFTGIGKTFNSFREFSSSDLIYNYGTGVRYTLKHLSDLRIGIDVAKSNEDYGWGISLGTGL